MTSPLLNKSFNFWCLFVSDYALGQKKKCINFKIIFITVFCCSFSSSEAMLYAFKSKS